MIGEGVCVFVCVCVCVCVCFANVKGCLSPSSIIIWIECGAVLSVSGYSVLVTFGL